MRCYALAVSEHDNPFNWYFGSIPFNLNSFHTPLKKDWHKDIMALAETLKPGAECSLKPDNFPFIINLKKRDTSCCIVLTDESLKKEELDNLFAYIHDLDLSPPLILKNFESFLKKDELLQIQEELLKTMQQMMKNIDILLQSQEDIKSLIERTEELTKSMSFKKLKIKEKSPPPYIFGIF